MYEDQTYFATAKDANSCKSLGSIKIQEGYVEAMRKLPMPATEAFCIVRSGR